MGYWGKHEQVGCWERARQEVDHEHQDLEERTLRLDHQLVLQPNGHAVLEELKKIVVSVKQIRL